MNLFCPLASHDPDVLCVLLHLMHAMRIDWWQKIVLGYKRRFPSPAIQVNIVIRADFVTSIERSIEVKLRQGESACSCSMLSVLLIGQTLLRLRVAPRLWTTEPLSDYPHTFGLTSLSFAMPICIECRYPVSSLYTTYSKADDKALGKGVRLTQCPACKIPFADKYVEHDFVVLFIDLVLIKPQVSLLVLIFEMY